MRALIAYFRWLIQHQKICNAVIRDTETATERLERIIKLLESMKAHVYPCPHTRDLTDAELERIYQEGEKLNKAQKRERLPGDEWKGEE